MNEIPEIPSEPVHPPEWPPHPPKKMMMNPLIITLGSMLVFFTVVTMVVILPTETFEPQASENWRPLTQQEQSGRDVFLANGCIYCHSGFTRPQDFYASQYYVYARVSEPGDYVGSDESPNLFGTQRTGPDLSQAGGYHPDDWHIAHYTNARYTSPISIMPTFNFLSEESISDLIAFTQARGGQLADTRSDHQNTMKELIFAAGDVAAAGENGDRTDGYPSAGAIQNLVLMDRGYWFADNPLPVTDQNLLRGREIYQTRCQGCHGSTGNGNGPGAFYLNPMPAAFDVADDQMTGSDTSPGAYYWRILRGVPGSGMENFGTRLSVDDIWKVVLFLKTIPNGGLTSEVPTTDQYIQWVGYPGLFTWGDCFESDATYFSTVAPTSGGPEGIGDVPGIVDIGELNPTYATSLWMADNNARPCGSTGYENVDLAMVLSDAESRTDGYAIQGDDQIPFIPPAMRHVDQLPAALLPMVWGQPNPFTEPGAGNQ
jgi:cbb3-type cytochrome c oxidase subunit II